MTWITLLLLSGALAGPACAQRFAGGAGGGRSGLGGGRNGRMGGRQGRYGRGQDLFWGDPFLFSNLDYGDSSFPPPPDPQERVTPAREPFGPPLQTQAEPLLIELQGNRYVRSGGKAGAEPEFLPAESAATEPAVDAAAELRPALLVYRDGHSEEVAEYAIVGSTLYASGDYWQNGKWTRDVQISALDLAATRLANEQRGIHFVLPSAPNVIVTRP